MLKRTALKEWPILAIAAIASTAGFVLWSRAFYGVGYPLDDSWIYQTYARNLIQLGEWSFVPGEASGGSTGPLWVLGLAIGYGLRLEPHYWAYLLGAFILFCLSVVASRAFKLICPQINRAGLLAGLFIIFEWHLVWAAVSGMETILAAWIATGILVSLLRPEIKPKDWFWIGLVVGIGIWVRPDSLLLLGPVAFVLAFGSQRALREKLKWGLFILSGLAIPVGAYLLFNQITSGTIWPNTFYAKQAEYAALKSIPFVGRYVQQFTLPLVGGGMILLPGFILTLIKTIRERRWALLACFLWFLGYLAVFAWRLPVTYQHGRYIIPAMPIFFILGLAGMLPWGLEHWRSQKIFPRILSKVWLISWVGVTGLFWLLGARAYALDVAIIESEMVASAKWIEANTPSDSLIASHDIGALGYFSQRRILDLAGLISPQVIPFIRDENRLANHLDESGADYLMTFPGWYPSLTARANLIFQTDSTFSPSLGGENMAIYKWENSNLSE